MIDPGKAVFLSYASQDAEAAKRICDALRAAGIEVWFDQSELRGGDAWDQKIRQQIRDCALFVPIISANTQARPEGYFRLEWKLAVDRSHLMAAEKAFLVPVVVDATSEPEALVPAQFRDVQWTRIQAGNVPDSFVDRIGTLLHRPVASQMSGPARMVTRAPARRLAIVVISLIVAALVAILIAMASRGRLSSQTSVPKVDAGAASVPAIDTPTPVPEKSVAVLPFVDMSEKHDQEYFADGLAEELINRLVAVRDLQVSARTSSFSYKGKSATIGEIAKALKVGYVVEGSVRTSGQTMRITAQLVRTPDGIHVWSQTYDRQLKDLLKTQDEISDSIAVALASRFTVPPRLPGDYPSGQPAYISFLQSQSAYRDSRRGVEAERLLRETVRLDPSFSRGWALLADKIAYQATYDVTLTKEAQDKRLQDALACAQRAIAGSPERNYGYVSLANMAMLRRDWSNAGRYLEAARSRDPQHSNVQAMTALLCQVMGDFRCSLENASRLVEEQPSRLLARLVLADSLSALGQHEEALREFRRAATIDPLNSDIPESIASQLLFLHRPQEAIDAIRSQSDATSHDLVAAVAMMQMGRREESKAIASRLEAKYVQLGSPSAFSLAELHARLGESEAAIAWLQKALAHDEADLNSIKATFAHYPGVIADRRYHSVLRVLGLPD